MPTYYTLNGNQFAEGRISVPLWGAWEVTGRLASSDGLTIGQPATLEVDGLPRFSGEISKLTVFSERVRVSMRPLGASILSAPLAPLYMPSKSRQDLATFFATLCGTSSQYYATDAGQILDSVTIPGTITGWQVLRQYFTRARFDPYSALIIGENIVTNSGDFTQQDETAFIGSGMIQLAINNDFALQPDEFWLYYKIKGLMYHLDASPRITAEVEPVQ
jgi:hypothetical protein